MFRRWAETRLYSKTMQLAVAELRRAARTSNALEKLASLDVAEQKLRDVLWLRPEARSPRFEDGLAEIARRRQSCLHEQAIPAVARLLEAAERGLADRDTLLQAAGSLLAFLYHYLPDEPQVEQLGARFRTLGGKQPPYQPVRPLSEMYRRPEGGAGCGALIGGLLLAGALLLWAHLGP